MLNKLIPGRIRSTVVIQQTIAPTDVSQRLTYPVDGWVRRYRRYWSHFRNCCVELLFCCYWLAGERLFRPLSQTMPYYSRATYFSLPGRSSLREVTQIHEYSIGFQYQSPMRPYNNMINWSSNAQRIWSHYLEMPRENWQSPKAATSFQYNDCQSIKSVGFHQFITS